MQIPRRSPSCLLVASCLLLMGCAGSDDLQPSAPATVIDATADDESNHDESRDNSSAPQPTIEINSETDETDETDETTDGESESESGTSDGGSAPGDALGEDTDESTTADPADTSARETPDDPANGRAGGEDLAGFLPPADELANATISEYLTLDELIADRNERPPVLRCDAATDPSALAISSQGQAAGRIFDDDNGVHTVTVQLWRYPDETVAAQALAAVRDLRCESAPVGNLVVGSTTYEQFDTLTATSAQLVGSAVDEASGASFQRQLSSPDGDLVVHEELQFARLGTVVVFAGAREIGSPDIAPSPPVTDALRVGQFAITAIAEGLGRTVDNLEVGTYRTTTIDFCLVRIERNDGKTAQISWAGGEQAVITVSPADQTIDVGSGCGSWTRIEAGAESVLPPGGVGTLLVGTDIDPGVLRVTSTGECTIDQLLGFSGAPEDLVASTLLAPGDSVEISVTDEAGISLSSGCRY